MGRTIFTAALAVCCGASLYAQQPADAAPCSYSLAYTSLSVPPRGLIQTVDLTTGAACGWSAAVDVPWITLIAGFSGTGSGTIGFAVAANNLPTSRIGHVTVQGQALTITEVAVLGPLAQVQQIWTSNIQVPNTVNAFPCTPAPRVVTTFAPTDPAAYVFVYVTQLAPGDVIATQYFAPDGTQYPGAGGSYTVPPEVQSACVEDPGMKIVGQQAASLPGLWTVKVNINGVLVITTSFTLSGTSSCNYTLSAASLSIPPVSTTGNTITVTTSNSCGWTAVSNVNWIIITAGSSGTGSGSVLFTASANIFTTSRTAYLAVAGQTVAVTQVATGGPPAQVTQIWMTRTPFPNSISSCSDASVPSTTFAPTDAAAYMYLSATQMRPGDVIADQYIAPDGTQYTAAGGTVTAPPLTPLGCWEDPGLMIRGTPAANKTGVWTVNVTVNGVLVITTSFTMLPGSNCSYALGSAAASYPAAGGSGTVAVTAGPGCSWTASTNVAWLHITSGPSGTGSGSVVYSVDVNSGDARTANLQIAGQAFTLNQASGLPPQPSIAPGGVADPWTYTKGVSPGAWISIYGSNLANSTATWSPAPGQPLATTLAGVSVTVDGVSAALSYVSPTLVNVLAPAAAHVGPVQIVVTNNGASSAPFPIQSTTFLPAIYSNAAPGTSPARYYVTAVDPKTNQLLGNPSADPRVTGAPHAGDTIDLYALGLGPAAQFSTDTDFSGAFPLTANPSVVLGGVSVAPSFAALVAPGLYQMRIVIPPALSAGDQPILLDFGVGVQSAPNVFLSIQR
jgi:uncharacterized protein (TIGR03437 family)